MPLAATWMQLEVIILSKPERERQIPYDITYMWTLNCKTNEHIYETETDSQTQRADLWLPRTGQCGSLGLADANYYIQQQFCSTRFPGAQTASLSTLGNHKSVLYICESVSVSQISSFASYFRFHI